MIKKIKKFLQKYLIQIFIIFFGVLNLILINFGNYLILQKSDIIGGLWFLLGSLNLLLSGIMTLLGLILINLKDIK